MAKVRGWKNIAAFYERSPSTVRGWPYTEDEQLIEGCPVWKEGNVMCLDTDTFTEWLDEFKPNWRGKNEAKGEGNDEADKSDSKKLKEQHMRQEVATTLKKEADAERAQIQLQEAKNEFCTKVEAKKIYAHGMTQVRNLVEDYVVRLKQEVPEISAARSDELDLIRINLFNELADMKLFKDEPESVKDGS